MQKMYSDYKNWTKTKWKESFNNLTNDGYSLEKIKVATWFKGHMEAWKTAVLINTNAHKVIDETEKALKFSIVNQYGAVYEMWLPKSTLEAY